MCGCARTVSSMSTYICMICRGTVVEASCFEPGTVLGSVGTCRMCASIAKQKEGDVAEGGNNDGDDNNDDDKNGGGDEETAGTAVNNSRKGKSTTTGGAKSGKDTVVPPKGNRKGSARSAAGRK